MTSYRAPLGGIRVLELGSSVAGPAAGRLLADLGAEVLKVEAGEGDTLRTWGPAAPDGTSWWFKSHNRNKRFLKFDLHAEADRAVVREIALRCDVVLENFRPGKLDEWGLGYDALRAENPRLVYASISGFGQDGPYRGRTGFGNIAESMSGLRYVTGYEDRRPCGSASRSPTSSRRCTPSSGFRQRSWRANATAWAITSTSRCSSRALRSRKGCCRSTTRWASCASAAATRTTRSRRRTSIRRATARGSRSERTRILCFGGSLPRSGGPSWRTSRATAATASARSTPPRSMR